MISLKPRVVVIGAGFGGLEAARSLARAPVEVVLVDQRNHHVFQPLLYQVATAALSPADIAGPIRAILKDQRNVSVMLDRVTGIEQDCRNVRLASGKRVTYDWLVVATGARHSYFGRDEWAAFAPGLKTIDDATDVRRKVLLALERAETETDRAKRDALLTFVVIGGGPTGVEMAGAIAELAHRSVSEEFRTITPHCSRVVLLDLAPRVLEAFPDDLAAAALRDLRKLGVEVKLGAAVTDIGHDFVAVGGERIATHTAIWAAGVAASPAAQWLDAPSDRTGRVLVDAALHPPGERAHLRDWGHRALSRSARTRAAGHRTGRQTAGPPCGAGDHGCSKAANRPPSITVITATSRRSAAATRWSISAAGTRPGCSPGCCGRRSMSDFLVGFRNRPAVGLSLLWNYLTFARHARLITGVPSEGAPLPIEHIRTGAEYVESVSRNWPRRAGP